MRALILLRAARLLAVLALAAGCVVTQHEVSVGSLGDSSVPLRTIEPPGIALCLSGGGYRAALFHTGVLTELNERGLLPRVRSVAGVSGGAIVGATLAMAWDDLEFDDTGRARNFDTLVTQRIRRLTAETLDVGAVLSTFTDSGSSRRIARGYSEFLFGDLHLADLPSGIGVPEFVFLATELSTGINWEFSKRRMGDRRLGYMDTPDVRLADVVAASSAFPAVFRPIRVEFAAEQLALAEPTEAEVKAWTLAALRDMGRDDRARALESAGLAETDQLALAAEFQKFQQLAFADKIDDGVYLIDGGLMNNLGSEYCKSAGLNIISTASTRWVGEVEAEPGGLISSMARIIVAMRRYAEARQLEELQHRSVVGRQLGGACGPGLDCDKGTVALIELSPRELRGDIRQALRVVARLRAIDPDVQRELLDWGNTRAAASLTALEH